MGCKYTHTSLLGCLFIVYCLGHVSILGGSLLDRIRLRHLPSLPHNRLDGMESTFHVLQWIVLRYVKHGMPKEDLGATLHHPFHEVLKVGDQIISIGRHSSVVYSVFETCVGLNNVLAGVPLSLITLLSMR
jgi:hypothetical protein